MAANMAHGDGRERLDLADGHQFRIVTWITIPTNSRWLAALVRRFSR